VVVVRLAAAAAMEVWRVLAVVVSTAAAAALKMIAGPAVMALAEL
jgi:hypothetical protein